MAGQSEVTTATKDSLNEPLENSFDASSVNEELGAQVEITRAFGQEVPKAVAEFSQERINDIKADPNLSIDEKLAEIAKWDEGGVYRVAAHTAIGALGTGSLEGSLTTGSVAAAAPKISEYENKLAAALESSGMSPEVAKMTSKGVTTLTLAGIGATAGLDTSSTATGINVDSNNRQLHPDEVRGLNQNAERYAEYKGLTIEEAKRRLLLGTLYNIDIGWRNSINYYASQDEIAAYQEAYDYIVPNSEYDYTTLYWSLLDPDLKSSENLSFTATEEEFLNETMNLKTLFKSTDDPVISEAIEMLYRDVPADKALEMFNKGGAEGAEAANNNASVDGDAKNFIKGILSFPKYIIESAKSDEVGLLDDQQMKAYYENLLVIQGRHEELGFIQGKSWNETQRAIQFGNLVGLGGGAITGGTRLLTKTNAVGGATNKAEVDAARVDNNINTDNNALDDSYPREEFWYKDDLTAPTVVRNPEVMNGLMRQNGIEFKQGVTPQQVFEDIYQTPKGLRPDPSAYLSPSYISSWKSKWDDGAVRIASIESVNRYKTLGSNQAFVIPKSEYDNLIKQTGGDLTEVEVKLSFPKGYLTSGEVGIYHIKPQSTSGVKIPSGNENGANTQWLPGGKTANGLQEGIVDLKNGNIEFERIN